MKGDEKRCQFSGDACMPSTLLISPAPKPVNVRLCLGREMPAGPTPPVISTMGAPVEGRLSLVGSRCCSVAMICVRSCTRERSKGAKTGERIKKKKGGELLGTARDGKLFSRYLLCWRFRSRARQQKLKPPHCTAFELPVYCGELWWGGPTSHTPTHQATCRPDKNLGRRGGSREPTLIPRGVLIGGVTGG